MKITFDLSGDFLETCGDVHYLASYLPTIDDDYDSDYSDSNTPLFGVYDADEEIIYNMAEKFDNGGVPDDAMMFLPIHDMDPRVRFKAKIENRGVVKYFYYCRLYDYIPNSKTCFSVSYPKNVVGTPLEKKLMAAVDETVRTMKREVLEVEHRPFR